MEYQTPTHHQEQTRKKEYLNGIKKCPHIRKQGVPIRQCKLCSTKTAQSAADPEIGSDESEAFYSADEMNTISDDEEYFSVHEEQATSSDEEDTSYLDLGPEEPDVAAFDHNDPSENYHNGSSPPDSGDGFDNTSGYRYGNKCTWHKFSRGVARRLMPPNIPRTKVTDREGVERTCPLVPELKLTTPEGEEYWLDGLTYYRGQGGWADSEVEDEDESIYD